MENATNPEPRIFFSYSRVDGEQYALRLANDLRNAGANVWIDQLDIELGKLWDLEVEKALNNANCILFITTEKSTTSNNVLNEVYYALEENKKVIPVVFHNCRIPFGLKRLQRIDFTTNYDEAFQRLLKALGLKATEPGAVLPAVENASIKTAGQKPVRTDTPEQTKEERFWNDALRENNATLFAEYLALYPEGQHKDEANRRLEALQIKEKATLAEEKEKQKAPVPQEATPVALAAEVPPLVQKEEAGRRPAKKWLWGLVAAVAAVLIFILVQNNSGTGDNGSVAHQGPVDSINSMVKDASIVTDTVAGAVSNSDEKTGFPTSSKKETEAGSQQGTKPKADDKKPGGQSGTDGSGTANPVETEEDRAKAIEQNYTRYMRSGLTHMETQDYAAAAADFENAIRTKQTSEALYYAGRAYGRLSNFPTALVYYNRAIAIDPVNWEYYNARGYAYYNSKDFPAATADYDKAIALNSNAGLAYVNRGLAKRALNDMAAACSDFMIAASMGNSEGQNQYNRYCQKKTDSSQVNQRSENLKKLEKRPKKTLMNYLTRFSIISPEDRATIAYPRTTKVVWNAVAGATSYVLVVEMGNTQTFDQSPTYRPMASYTTTQTTYTFQGIGFQVHRYKVIAKNGDNTTIAETPWRYIAYSS